MRFRNYEEMLAELSQVLPLLSEIKSLASQAGDKARLADARKLESLFDNDAAMLRKMYEKMKKSDGSIEFMIAIQIRRPCSKQVYVSPSFACCIECGARIWSWENGYPDELVHQPVEEWVPLEHSDYVRIVCAAVMERLTSQPAVEERALLEQAIQMAHVEAVKASGDQVGRGPAWSGPAGLGEAWYGMDPKAPGSSPSETSGLDQLQAVNPQAQLGKTFPSSQEATPASSVGPPPNEPPSGLNSKGPEHLSLMVGIHQSLTKALRRTSRTSPQSSPPRSDHANSE